MHSQEHRGADTSSLPIETEAGWYVLRGRTLYQVEALLDWLDQCGGVRKEVEVTEGGVTLRWRRKGSEDSGQP